MNSSTKTDSTMIITFYDVSVIIRILIARKNAYKVKMGSFHGFNPYNKNLFVFSLGNFNFHPTYSSHVFHHDMTLVFGVKKDNTTVLFYSIKPLLFFIYPHPLFRSPFEKINKIFSLSFSLRIFFERSHR